MNINHLSFDFNRVINIFNRIFPVNVHYRVTSSRYDESNEQLSLYVQYEITKDDSTYYDLKIIFIPKWILEQNTFNNDLDGFIKDTRNLIGLNF